MSSQQATSNTTTGTGWSIERLLPYEKQIGYVLVAIGLLLAAIPIANGAMYRNNSLAVLIWGACLSLFTIGVGLYAVMPPAAADAQSRTERLRWIFLLAAGGAGALTALLGLVLPFCTMPMSLTNYPEIFTGGPKSWRTHGPEVGRCIGALIGGLVLMFAGLQLARPVQRTSMSMRRWLYGYNAILSSLLLLFILMLVNVLPYTAVKPFSYAMEAMDWTSGQLYTLHPATRNLLADLKEPVKVYMLIPSGSGVLERDVLTLLNNCRTVNSLFSWEQLSRDRNPGEIVRLIKQYQLPDSLGLLVVYGTEPNVTSQFIKVDELAENTSGPNADKTYLFKGENALLNGLTYLSSGKSRAIVYFTQGNGEPDLNDQGRAAGHFDMGLGVLQEELNKINYQAHPLNLSLKTTSIPEDADIVVVARPQEKLPDNAIKALRDFLQGTNRKDNKKGKLIVLFDVNVRKGQMIQTGLEPLLAEYGVKVGNDRVLGFPDPHQLTTVTNPRSGNPIARAFVTQGRWTALFPFYDARTVEPAAPAGAPSAFTAETLIIAHPRMVAWAETNLQADPRALVNELRRDQQKLLSKISDKPLSLAVSVTEGKGPPPIPGHEFMAPESEPRMVVFGDASWITNNILLEATPDNFALFSSTLSWLAGRHDIGERIPTSTRNVYRLKVAPREELRLIFLPGVLLMMGVLVLGLGVWVVRRR